VSGPTVDQGRRRFFSRVLKWTPGGDRQGRGRGPACRRLTDWTNACETDLLAFGPDLLAATARRTAGVAESAGYADVAKALAQDFGKTGHER
jgi:hypothetical protein